MVFSKVYDYDEGADSTVRSSGKMKLFDDDDKGPPKKIPKVEEQGEEVNDDNEGEVEGSHETPPKKKKKKKVRPIQSHFLYPKIHILF